MQVCSCLQTDNYASNPPLSFFYSGCLPAAQPTASKHRRQTASIGNESVPIQLVQCRFPGLAISNANIYKYIFQVKYTEVISSNSIRKLFWFEITKIMIADEEKNYRVIYDNFWHTFVPYWFVT